MGIVKKSLKWLIVPAVFSTKQSHWNPFYQLRDFKGTLDNFRPKAEAEILKDKGLNKSKHQEIVEYIKSLSDEERNNLKSLCLPKAIALIHIAILPAAYTYYCWARSWGFHANQGQFIIDTLKCTYVLMTTAVAVGFFFRGLGFVWQYRTLTNPEKSLPFTEYLFTPSKWFKD